MLRRKPTDVGTRAAVVYAFGLLANVRTAAAPRAEAFGRVNRALTDPAPSVRLAGCDAVDRYAAAARLPNAPAGELGAVYRVVAAPLERVLAHDTDPAVRARAALALAEFAGAPAAKAVAAALAAAALNDDDTDVRRHAAWSLSRAFASDVARTVAADGAQDADEVVRIQFARLLGRRADPSLGKELALLLRDASWRVREQAIEARRSIEKHPLTEHLTAIPAGVVTPNPSPAPDATAPALPRQPLAGKPGKPVAERAIATIPVRIGSTAESLLTPSAGPHPRVRITTTQGAIVLRLYPEWAPLTVENFLDLTDRGYFDNLRWFRIVPDFVAQTGDPRDDGEGDAGYQIPAEENPLEQRSGIISMGLNYDKNGPERDSAGTQFYITISPQYHLDRDFTVFGAITEGFDVLGRLLEKDRMVKVERIADG